MFFRVDGTSLVGGAVRIAFAIDGGPETFATNVFRLAAPNGSLLEPTGGAVELDAGSGRIEVAFDGVDRTGAYQVFAGDVPVVVVEVDDDSCSTSMLANYRPPDGSPAHRLIAARLELGVHDQGPVRPGLGADVERRSVLAAVVRELDADRTGVGCCRQRIHPLILAGRFSGQRTVPRRRQRWGGPVSAASAVGAVRFPSAPI